MRKVQHSSTKVNHFPTFAGDNAVASLPFNNKYIYLSVVSLYMMPYFPNKTEIFQLTRQLFE